MTCKPTLVHHASRRSSASRKPTQRRVAARTLGAGTSPSGANSTIGTVGTREWRGASASSPCWTACRRVFRYGRGPRRRVRAMTSRYDSRLALSSLVCHAARPPRRPEQSSKSIPATGAVAALATNAMSKTSDQQARVRSPHQRSAGCCFVQRLRPTRSRMLLP